jgi:signal transduction histidine kinase
VGTVDTRWLRKDGGIIDVLVSSAAIDPSDFSKGISFAAVNITERKRTEVCLADNAKKLQQLSHKLISAQEEERRALARELHDDLGQQLVALKLDLAMLKRDLRDLQYQQRLADCIQLAEHVRESIKQTARRLRPALLDDLGLAEALHWYARSQAERAGCAIEVRDRLPSSLSPELEMAVFRIVQEAVGNAIRHGRARRIDIVVAVAAGELTLAVQDDGAGFDPDALSNNPAATSGLGLSGMRERAALLDGRFSLASRPGAGVRVEVAIPLPRSSE